MPSVALHVALGEVLEVRGGPLSEREMWAVLSLAADTLQLHLNQGEAGRLGGPAFAVALDTLLLGAAGRVMFTEVAFDSLRSRDYAPPEWNPRQDFTRAQIEKIYVFALGVSMYNAADHNLEKDEELSISDTLDGLLGAMCEDDATVRADLYRVLEACRANARRANYASSDTTIVQGLYRLVMGSGEQLAAWPELDLYEHSGHRSVDKTASDRNSTRSHDRSRGSNTDSRTRSRSRSKPRSRSRSGDRSSRFSSRQERPVPVGRDHTPEHRDKYGRYSPFSHPPHFMPYPPAMAAYGSLGHLPPYPSAAGVGLSGYDPYMMAAHGMQHGGFLMRMGEARGMYGPSQGALRSMSPRLPLYEQTDSSPSGAMADPEIRKAYERIKDRQQKLAVLKRDLEDDRHSDTMSMASEATDFGEHRSVISANSYTQGVYRPDLLAHYGPDRALRMRREGEPEVDQDGGDTETESLAASEAAWIRRQEHEIQAMQRALENFIERSNSQAELRSRSRQRSRTPGPSRPVEKPRSRQRASSEPRARSKSREDRRLANRIPRKHYGPEFLQTDKVTSIHVPQATSTNVKDVRHVIVHMLSGAKLDLTCEASTLGRDLFDAVVAHLGLPEHYLFGLTYVLESESFFIDPDQKLSKVAPSAWKDPGRGRQPPPFTLYFRVKFYVENVAVIKHPTTKQLFYVQLRRDLLEDKIPCSEQQALTLAGLAMQAEYGDWYEKCRDFIPELYLPPHIIKQLGKSHARDNLPLEHRKHRGMPEEAAQLRFIRLVQQLDDYGVHYYRVYRSKKDTKAHNAIWTGISVQGILTAEQPQGLTKVVTRRHPWQLTQKISFNRRRFSIKPKSEMGIGKVAKLDYYTDSYKKGRYLLKLATAHHRFMVTMRMHVEPNLANLLHPEEEWDRASECEGDDADYSDEEHDDVMDDAMLERGDVMIENDDVSYTEELEQEAARNKRLDETFEDYTDSEIPASNYANISQRPSSRNTAKESLPQRSRTPSQTQLSHRSRSPDRSPDLSQPSSRAGTPGVKVIGVSIRSRDSGFLPVSSEPVSDTLKERFESMAAASGALERRIAAVELEKEPRHGIGVTIKGGAGTGTGSGLGCVVVQSLVPGGPAERSGRVHVGDRLIAINGTSLEGLTHHSAVQLIQQATGKVQLLLSQVVEPSSPRREPLDRSISETSLKTTSSTGGGALDVSSAGGAPFSKPVRTKLNAAGSQESLLNASTMSLGRQNGAATNGGARVQRSESMESSDLDIEDVIPPEAMSTLTIGGAANVSRDEKLVARGMENVMEKYRRMLSEEDKASQQQQHEEEYDEEDKEDDSEGVDGPSSPSHSQHGDELTETPEAVMATLVPGDEYQIVLCKSNNSLGLNVAGGVNTTVKDGGIYVKSFAENGAAETDGRIKIGDRLLSINGVSLIGVTHKQAVEKLRSAPPTAQLRLVRGVPPFPPPAAVTHQSPLSSSTQTTPTHSPQRVVSPGGQSTASESLRPATDMRTETEVTTDIPSSSIDDTEEDPYSFVNSENVFKITLKAQEGEENCEDEKGNTYEVDVRRSSSGLGFSVLGGIDQHSDPRHCIVRVKKVFPHGAAYQAGLQEGDVLLQVNNHTLGNLANKEVLHILRTARPEARLLVCRPESGVLPSITQLKQDLDTTVESQGSIPMATSTPTADQILNDSTTNPPEKLTPCSPIADIDSSTGDRHYDLISPPLDGGPTPTNFHHADHFTSLPISPNQGILSAAPNLHKPLTRVKSHGIELDSASEGEVSYSDDEEEEGSGHFEPQDTVKRVEGGNVQKSQEADQDNTLVADSDDEDDNDTQAPNRSNMSNRNAMNTSAQSAKKHVVADGSHTELANKHAELLRKKEEAGRGNVEALGSMYWSEGEENSETEVESEGGSEGELEEDSLNTNTAATANTEQSRYTSATTASAADTLDTSSARRRTPSPVKTFLRDAGLTSGEPTPAATPSVEQMLNKQAGDDSSTTSAYSDRHERSSATPGDNKRSVVARRASGSDDGVTGSEGVGDSESEEDSDLDLEKHEFEVTLTKGDKGLGFTVAGGHQAVGVFYVKDVLYNPALVDGRITPGDRLIAVNGEDMTCKNHREAVDYLRQTPSTVTLRFLRHDDWETSEATTTTAATSHRKREVIDARGSYQDSLLRKNAQQLIDSLDTARQHKQEKGQLQAPDVQLTDEDSESDSEQHTPTLGKSTSKQDTSKLGVSRPVDDPDPPSIASSFGNITIPVTELDSTPPAARCKLQERGEEKGEEPTSPQAQPRSSVIQISLERRQDEGGLGFTRMQIETGPTSIRSSVIQISLERRPDESGLGFTLVQGEKGPTSALFVRSISPTGLAAADGRLRVGDKLLQVNGESVIGMPHNKAVALIKKSTVLHIAVSRGPSRPPSTVPPHNRATPSRELQDRATPVNVIEAEETDSDVDSATLDDSISAETRPHKMAAAAAANASVNSSLGWPMSGRNSAKTVDTEGSNEDELGDTFAEGSDAYHAFLEHKGGVRREERMQPVPTRPEHSVPERLNQQFLASLPLVQPPRDSLHYSGRQLLTTCQALRAMIERDDPIEEYKSLKHAKLTDNCLEARKPANKTKNRFRNVIPYDANRVVLQGLDDYINASHVQFQVARENHHYIATQGPMPETMGDFWCMVWEQDVHVVAMVTQDMEGGKVKCQRYWPYHADEPLLVDERYEVRLCRVEQLDHLDVNHLQVSDLHDRAQRHVTHLNFNTWPDTGTPESAVPLLQYMALMRRLQAGSGGPVVVHCSAGIGRTGALITIDLALAYIQHDLKFDLQKIAQDLRRQRQGMIQTKDQYRFCYKAVLDALSSLQATPGPGPAKGTAA